MSSAVNDNTDLPKGWKIQTIENLFKIKSGEFLSAQMMDENGLYDVYGGNGINGKYNKYNLRDENIIIGRVGANCGNVRLVNDKLWITDNAFYISEYFKDINKKYLYNFLSYIELGKTSNTSAQPVISYKGIKDIEIPLPPLPEQQRIVEKLDRLFANIDTAIALSEENLQHANNLLPAALNEVFENDKKWKESKIDDIAIIKGGKRLPKGDELIEEKTPYPYIRVSDFSDDGTIDLSKIKYLKESSYKQIKNYIINTNDLYISIAGTIGKTGIIPKELNGANLTENAARFVFKNEKQIFNKYVYYFTLSSYFIEQAGVATKTVAQPKLALTRLKEVLIPVPDLPTQQKIVQHLNALSAQQQQLQQHYTQQLQQLKALKASLLHAAFRGEL